MANSTIIGNAKNEIIKELISDDAIVQAIEPVKEKVKTKGDLVNQYVFNYNQNPSTIHDVMTFITVQANIVDRWDYNGTYSRAQVIVLIVSHEDHMRVNNIPKITENRNDYLSKLIDKKLNGKSSFGGIGKLTLVSNVESAYQSNWLVREMIFETKDLNNAICNS